MPNTPGIHDEAEVEKVARAMYFATAGLHKRKEYHDRIWAGEYGLQEVGFTVINEEFGNEEYIEGRENYRILARAALSAIDVAGIRAAWQNIETAPRDGTQIEVIIWMRDFRDTPAESGHWHPYSSRFKWNGQNFESIPRQMEFGIKAYTPGHCMWRLPAPLPLPPALSMGKENGE